MGKNDFLTPKAIGNRIKSKGLQKLRWYCQMCQKQCRDENGFKCHLTSDSHKRQMMVFGEAPDRVVEGYSEEFEANFLEHLRQAHPSTRVSAKVVYNEFIADKHHVHMNSTKWYTLTEFVKYLGRTGKCKVDETPKGWYISLIKVDMDEELAHQRRAKRERAEKAEEERLAAAIEEQAERAKKMARIDEEQQQQPETAAAELRRDEDAAPLKIALATASKAPPVPLNAPNGSAALRLGFADVGHDPRKEKGPTRPKTQMELLMEAEQAAKRARDARAKDTEGKKAGKPATEGRKDDPWLRENIIVKVMSAELKQHGYYKKKGRVVKLVSKYVGQIEMLDSGDLLQVDQAQLETVLPSEGGRVMVLRGPHAGSRAQMLGVDQAKFQAHIHVKGGPDLWMEYEDISKLASPT